MATRLAMHAWKIPAEIDPNKWKLRPLKNLIDFKSPCLCSVTFFTHFRREVKLKLEAEKSCFAREKSKFDYNWSRTYYSGWNNLNKYQFVHSQPRMKEDNILVLASSLNKQSSSFAQGTANRLSGKLNQN